MLFSLARLGYNMGRLTRDIDSRIEQTRSKLDAEIREQYYEIITKMTAIESRLTKMESEGDHRDELTAIRTESIIATIVADISNIVNNIDDIELYLMKTGYARRNRKLIHGKKRKLAKEDITTMTDDEE